MTMVYACKDDGRSCVLEDRVATQAHGTYFESLLHLPTLHHEATSYLVRVVQRHDVCELEMRPPMRSAIWSCSLEPAATVTYPMAQYAAPREALPSIETSRIAPSPAIALMLLMCFVLLEITRRRWSNKAPAPRSPPPVRWETCDGREHAASTFSGTAQDVTYLLQKRL